MNAILSRKYYGTFHAKETQLHVLNCSHVNMYLLFFYLLKVLLDCLTGAHDLDMFVLHSSILFSVCIVMQYCICESGICKTLPQNAKVFSCQSVVNFKMLLTVVLLMQKCSVHPNFLKRVVQTVTAFSLQDSNRKLTCLWCKTLPSKVAKKLHVEVI